MPTDLDEARSFLKELGGTPPSKGAVAPAPPSEPSHSGGNLDEARGFLHELGGAPSAHEEPSETALGDEPLHEQFRVGMKQGLLGYAEAPAYYLEKGIRQFKPEFRLNPFGIRDWAKAYRERAESTPAGVAGEMAGTVAPLFLPGLGELGFAGRAAMGAEDLSRMARLTEAFRAAQAGSKAGKVATEAARPGEIWAKGFSEVERNKGDLGKLSEIIGKNRPVEAPPMAEAARPRLQFQPPPRAGMLSRVAESARTAGELYRQNVNPLVRGGLQGGVMALLSRPATTKEEAEDQFLTGLFLGAAGSQLRLPHFVPKFIDGEFYQIRTPAGKAAQHRLTRELLAGQHGRRLQRRSEIILRSLGFFGGHTIGHAMGVPGAGWVGGHFLGEMLPYMASRGRLGLDKLGAIPRRVGRAVTAHPGPTGAALSPLMGYPVPYQFEEDTDVQP